MSADDAAKWMISEIQKRNSLDQDSAVFHVRRQFGDEYAYINQNGNLAIAPSVLKAFRKLTGDDVVWERSSRMWRKRQHYDKPGRQQQ